MSRIGKKAIQLPQEVNVTVDDNNYVTVKGPLGTLSEQINKDMIISREEDEILIKRPSDNKKHKSLHGLTRSLIANMVHGVTKGYEKKLEIVGVGYRAVKQGNQIVLSLGYSHTIELTAPEGITIEAPTQTEVVVKGIDKQRVGNYAAKIRAYRKPEPYKGKGVRYAGEYIRRKEGKTGK
ncbi:50S ribosomal protein L6 [Tindallia californiensis]|uniref:Large ribosomal subunit protein uL6 n=1 Tax=Tindallia californiensis TaxID=159292 RepID=A0A1H3QXU8_9FIRM|nr:50S ribosomal protein L6 [Tindallia californiensis]SDZ18176.1 large subunit ribosomal protein L6 [Tindallia californiensis]